MKRPKGNNSYAKIAKESRLQNAKKVMEDIIFEIKLIVPHMTDPLAKITSRNHFPVTHSLFYTMNKIGINPSNIAVVTGFDRKSVTRALDNFYVTRLDYNTEFGELFKYLDFFAHRRIKNYSICEIYDILPTLGFSQKEAVLRMVKQFKIDNYAKGV